MARSSADLRSGLAVALLWLLAGACAAGPAPRAGATGGAGQFLFRAEVRTPEHDANLRLVLRTDGSRRFQLTAADLIGRTIWSFTVDGERFLWVDHRQRKFCRGAAHESIVLPLLRLELSPAAAPRILLGELPVALPSGARADDAGRVSFSDASGRRWQAELSPAGELKAWQLNGATGVTSATFQRESDGGELVLPGRDLTVRWRRASAEPLPRSWSPLSTPTGFKESACELGELP